MSLTAITEPPFAHTGTQQLRRALAAIMLCAAILLTGCGQSPGASSSAPAPVTSTGKSYGAPPLTQPELDVMPFVEEPCKLLTARQLALLGVSSAGVPFEGGLGTSCRWTASEEPSRISFGIDVNSQLGGLDNLYARKDTFTLWKPIEISGYPAVLNDEDTQSRGHCRMNVAISNTVLVAVDVQLTSGVTKPADFTDPCPRGIKVLEQVVATLKGGK